MSIKGEDTSQEESKKVFVCYAHEDEDLCQVLEKHLKALEKQGLIDVYYDRQISPGTEWAYEIDNHFDTAQIILLLVSPNFMGSNYCYNVEMKRAMARHKAGAACVIPVILRPVLWENTPIGKLQALPKDAKPVTTWTNRDDAFLNIAKSIRKVVEELRTKYKFDPSISANSEQLDIDKANSFPPIWSVPYEPNPFFIGREDVLQHLHDSFRADNATALTRRQAISGLGGTGKTQIAIEYAYRFRNEYQAVLWARAESREVLASDFGTISYLLNLPEKKGRNQGRIIDAVMRWLHDYSDWLLILDNIDDLTIVKEFIPSLSTGHLLLTTCAQAMGGIAQRVGIEEMEHHEAVLFLLCRARLITNDTSLNGTAPDDLDKAKEIVQLMGGLPLALDQAGAYIEETACSLSDYLNLYQQQHAELLKRRGGFSEDHPRPVATTWSLSFEKIAQANPASAELLRLCAFLYPDAIPEEIITKGAPDLGPVLQDTASDLLKLNAAIEELLRYSLIRRDSKTKTLTIHRLVQSVLKDDMKEDIHCQWAERVVRAVNRALPDVDFATWPYIQQCLPQAQICTVLIETYDMKFPEVARLLTQTGYYLYERAQFAEAEPLYKRAVKIYEQTMGPEHSNLARSLSLLATLYNARGKYTQAEPLYWRALKIQEKTAGPESRDVATNLNDLGILYRRQGKYVQAESLLQQSLQIREKILGLEHLHVATSLRNLGMLYWMEGKYNQAKLLLQRALMIFEKAGPEDPDLARVLGALGTLFNTQRKYDEAEPLLKRALAIEEKIWGPEHTDVAIYLNELGVLYRRQGRYDEAEPLLKRALAIREKTVGPEHPDVAISLNNLAKLYCKRGKYDAAKLFFQRTLMLREKTLGSEHPLFIASLESYIKLLREMNQEDEAAQSEARIKAIRAMHLPKNQAF